MTQQDAEAKILEILKPVSELFFVSVNKELGGKIWRRAYFDVRFGSERNNKSCLEKTRAVLSDGTIIEVAPPRKGSFRVLDAYRIRCDTLSVLLDENKLWYGVVMHAFPNGTTVIEFLYDQHCLSKGFGENRDLLVPPPRGYEHCA